MLARVRVLGGGMSAQTNHAQRPDDQTRTAELADWIARNAPARLRAVAWRHGVPASELDDVVQSALTDFLRGFPGPHDTTHALSYTFRCVQNRSLKYHRWHRRRQVPLVDLSRPGDSRGGADALDTLAGEAADPLERVIDRENHGEALLILGELPAQLREIVALKGLGYSPAEVARMTGLSHRAVRKRIERANRFLGHG